MKKLDPSLLATKTIVVSPLIALAQQQVVRCEKLGLKVASMIGDTPALAPGAEWDVLIVTAERFVTAFLDMDGDGRVPLRQLVADFPVHVCFLPSTGCFRLLVGRLVCLPLTKRMYCQRGDFRQCTPLPRLHFAQRMLVLETPLQQLGEHGLALPLPAVPRQLRFIRCGLIVGCGVARKSQAPYLAAFFCPLAPRAIDHSTLQICAALVIGPRAVFAASPNRANIFLEVDTIASYCAHPQRCFANALQEQHAP